MELVFASIVRLIERKLDVLNKITGTIFHKIVIN